MNSNKKIHLTVILLLSLLACKKGKDSSNDKPKNTIGAGTLDKGFGANVGDGIIQFGMGGNSCSDAINSCFIQPDGKILVGGSSNLSQSQSSSDFALVRINENGTFDNSFGVNSRVLTDFTSARDLINSVALQNDGKIVVGGETNFNSFVKGAVVRYNSNGTIDNNFGSSGKVIVPYIIKSIVIQADQKIVVAGYNKSSRINTDGSFDTSFGISGETNLAFSGCSVIKIDANNNFIYGGNVIGGNGTKDFAIGKLNANGNLDYSFGGTGYVTTDFNNTEDEFGSLEIQKNGKILACGTRVSTGSIKKVLLIRYNSNGSTEKGFETSITNNSHARAINIQNDGKILVAGYYEGKNSSGYIIDNFLLARFEENLALDTTFDYRGFITTQTDGQDFANSLTIQTDGKIVLAGISNRGGCNYGCVARYLAQ